MSETTTSNARPAPPSLDMSLDRDVASSLRLGGGPPELDLEAPEIRRPFETPTEPAVRRVGFFSEVAEDLNQSVVQLVLVGDVQADPHDPLIGHRRRRQTLDHERSGGVRVVESYGDEWASVW